MPIGISKATGLEFLAREMGISMKEIMAFGDFDNDADMLREVGLGVAVENATENVKSNADLVIGSCADNGPAIFLKELMSNHS